MFMRFSVNWAMGTSLPKSITLSLKWGKIVQAIIYENVVLFFYRCFSFGYFIID